MNKKIQYRNHTVSQASNNHVMICKDGEMVFHAEVDKKLTDDELKENVDFYLDVLLPSIDESEKGDDSYDRRMST